MLRLPVSGLQVAVRQPAGSEDLLLREKAGSDIELALSLIERVAWAADGTAIDWGLLSITDIEILLLRIHQAAFGDAIRAEARCADADCGARVDIAFSADA